METAVAISKATELQQGRNPPPLCLPGLPSETVDTNTYPCASAAAALQPNKWLKEAPARAFASGGDSQRWLQSV